MPIDIRGVCPLLKVFDMERSLNFYTGALGFTIARRSDAPYEEWWALLERDGTEIMLGSDYSAKNRPSAPDTARVAAHGDASLFFGCPDVDSAYADLQSRGIEAEEPFVQPYGMKQLYLKDPDGYSLCLQWPA